MLPCVSPEEWDIITKDTLSIEPDKLDEKLIKLKNHPGIKLVESLN